MISVEEYLYSEEVNQCRSDLIGGRTFEVAAVSANQNRVRGNIYHLFSDALASSACEVFGSNFKVRVGDNFFYPSLSLVDELEGDKNSYTDKPIAIVEIVSSLTRKPDLDLKVKNYFSLDQLCYYIVANESETEVKVYDRSLNWNCSHYFADETIILTIKSRCIEIPVNNIYKRVHKLLVRRS